MVTSEMISAKPTGLVVRAANTRSAPAAAYPSNYNRNSSRRGAGALRPAAVARDVQLTAPVATPESIVARRRKERFVADGEQDEVVENGVRRESLLSRHSGAALGVAALALLASAPEAHAAVAELGSKLTIPGVVGDSPLTEGLVSGFLLILFSEIGDKTFFIAMLLALQQSKAEVFTGTFGALAIMTVISVGLGQVLHQVDELLPPGVVNLPLDDIFAVVLLVIFGVQTLQAAGNADANAAGEKEEAEETVAGFGTGSSFGFVLSTFALVFAAEWGDKSFIATIALAAASSPVGVVGGAVAGHGVATAIAVTFGSVLSKYVSERTVQYVGGSLFLVFAAATLVDIFAETQG